MVKTRRTARSIGLAGGKVGVGVMLVEEEGLPLADHAQNAVVQDQDHQGDILCNGSGQLVQVHAEAAVAGDQDGLFTGTHGGTHGSAHTEAHGAQTAAGNEPAGGFKVDIPGGPHLVLAHVGGHGGIGTQMGVQGFHDVSGGDAGTLVETCFLVLLSWRT